MTTIIRMVLRSTLVGLLFVLNAHGQVPLNDTSPSAQRNSNGSIDREADPHPLKPADLSSPRDTLRSFLSDTEQVVEQWIEAGQLTDATSYRAYSRAASALDFSTTPDGGSRLIQTHRILMLWEILGRLEIPSISDIPGDDEVEELGVTRWTFPNTSVTIEKIERGPRAGEFLFSEGTVERLDRYYRMVKDRPSRSESRAGVYEAFLKSQNADTADERQVRNRLRPIDRSNPRSTLMGFVESVNLAYVIVMDADAALRASPPTVTKSEAIQAELAAKSLMQQAITALDLSEVPVAQQDDVGMERALQLKEILDRMNLPPIDSIPNADMVAVERERLNKNGPATVLSVRWRYPNTEIEIVEILEGEHQYRSRLEREPESRCFGYQFSGCEMSAEAVICNGNQVLA